MQTQIITQITDNAIMLFDKASKCFDDAKPFKLIPIQEGIHDILQIDILNTQVRYALNDFNWDSFDKKFDLPEIQKVTAEAFEPMAEAIAKNFENYFNEKGETMFFTYKFELVFKFKSFRKSYFFENQQKKQALKKAMDNYIQELIIDENRKIKDDTEIYIFNSRFVDFNLMQYTEYQFIELVEKAFEVFEKPKYKKFNDTFKTSLFTDLGYWKNKVFYPLYFDVVDEFMNFSLTPKPEFAIQKSNASKFDPTKIRTEDLPKVDLFVRQAVWRIQKREPYADGRNDLLFAVGHFGSEIAEMYLKTGSGNLPKSLIYFKDNDLECKANDIFATILISLKTETAESYRKALDFVINLLNNGFPKSYQIKFTSKAEKKFLPIKGLAKSQTHRFFAQVLCYPELYGKLQEYAEVAMHQFEWYEDIEASEKSCMPSSYAVFGLGLENEKYFPLVLKYLKEVDDEHQSVHLDFLDAFIEKWGITEKSLPVMIAGAFSGQFHRPFKSVKKLMNKETKTLITNAIEQYEGDYGKSTLEFMLLGKPYE